MALSLAVGGGSKISPAKRRVTRQASVMGAQKNKKPILDSFGRSEEIMNREGGKAERHHCRQREMVADDCLS